MHTHLRTWLPLLLAGSLSACANGDKSGDDTDVAADTDGVTDTDVATDTDGVTDTDETVDTDVPLLAKPILGAQIDRVGRPGVSTILIDAYNAGAMADLTRDNYNHDATQASWATTWSEKIRASAAIWDALDTQCGNTLGAAAGPASASTYSATAALFADDQLYVDAGGTGCTQYMAVELGASGQFSDGSCGGRIPAYDTTDVTLSLLVVGSESGLGDGVSLSAGSDTFPFLADPR
jgi:hypothetical protein